jgi:prepilin-type N-terminal cleavage/methylation domain-containing protein
MTRSHEDARGTDAGYTLIELLISMGILGVVMAATMGGLVSATKANEAVLNVSTMNTSIRAGMDLMIRDMLQVGSGLPPGHVIEIPNGAGSSPIRQPGPPGTAWTRPTGSVNLPAVLPTPGGGPTLNGVATDVLSVMMADNSFTDISLTAITPTTVTIAAGPNIGTGPDKVSVGQLMMVTKGSTTTLVQVTSVDLAARKLTFAAGDSLNLNQPSAANGTLNDLNNTPPANTPSVTRISRVRMVTYYLDAATDPKHPRLVRRINNGDPMTFDNTSGNAVAIDVENLQFSFDVVTGTTNPSGVRMTAVDKTTSGACSPNPCSEQQIRKVNVALTGRSRSVGKTDRVFRNTLASQVSFRGMAFVDEYKAP